MPLLFPILDLIVSLKKKFCTMIERETWEHDSPFALKTKYLHSMISHPCFSNSIRKLRPQQI